MTLRTHAPRSKPCAHCSKPFIPARPMQAVCSPRCAAQMVKVRKAKEKAADRERKRALETIPELIKEAQKWFNKFVRLRDEGKPCICCGRFAVSGALTGGEWDCGHYRSTGSAPHLRFHESNAHRQLKACNRYGAGRAVDYRIGLIQRIGVEQVDALESDNRIHKWTRDELREVIATYKAKCKEIEKE